MVSVRCVLSLAVQNDWNVYQLDINNAFLYGELVEDVYMSLPEGYFSNNDKRVCKLQKSLYWLKQAPRKWNEKLTSVLYDILITGNDVFEINKCKDLLSFKFLIKDLGEHKYFLGVEVIKNDKGTCLSQRKYNLELLSEFGMLVYNITGFQKLVGKLIYLTITRPDISYVVHKLSQVMHASKLADMKSAFKVLSKIQSVLAKSSGEAEYKAMSSVACEVIWILKILTELKVEYKTPVEMFCDNSSAIQIAANHVFHERTKHFEIDLFS
ncbi:ribonuclease H-like domain-containing protein [Tanacetum coccineum]